MEIKFYFCDHCKNVAIKVVDHSPVLLRGKDDRTGTRHRGCRSGEASSRIYGKKRDCLRTCRLRGASDDPGALYLPDRRADRPRCAV